MPPREDYETDGDDVLEALSANNWSRLRELSLRPRGFGKHRKEVWPYLLHAVPESQNEAANTELPTSSTDGIKRPVLTNSEHQDERQVSLDTERSFVVYPSGPKSRKKHLQQRLHALIITTLRKRPLLHYFQGYHDIVSVLMLTLPDDVQPLCVEKLSLHRIRDSMGKGLEPLLGQLRILRNLIRLADPLYASLLEENTPLPYFSLSNLLTLFSHDVPSLPEIQQIFDYILTREPLAPVYLAAQILLDQKEKAFELVRSGEEGMLHSVLMGWPFISKDLDAMSDVMVSPSTSSINLSLEDSRIEESESLSDGLDSKIEPEDNYLSGFGLESSVDEQQLVELCKLLERTDQLRSLYPPSHHSLQVNDILGPQSCARTWSESTFKLPTDSYAEKIVEHPETVVFPYDPTPPASDLEDEKEKKDRRRRRQPKATASLPLQPSAMIAAGAIMVIGVAVAIYLRNPDFSKSTWRNLQTSAGSFGARCRALVTGS